MADTLSVCSLEDIIVSGETCEESFSGTGSRLYLALVSDLNGQVGPDMINFDKNEFKPTAFAELEGKLFAWDIEDETGEATYETNVGGGGFINKQEVTIRKNMDLVSHGLRTLNNQKFLAFVPDGKGKYYVYYSVMGAAKLESATGTSGKAATDEHGHTITISAGPMYFPQMKWAPADEGGKAISLDAWLKSAA